MNFYPQDDHTATAGSGGLHHALTTAQLGMIAIGGAIGTGLFLGSSYAISLAGPGVLLSYGLCAIVALLLMGSLAEMCAALPAAGSFGTYAEMFLGPWAGFVVRYTYWACIVLAVGAEVSATAVYMGYWFPRVQGGAWIAGFAALMIAVNALEVKTFGAVEYGFSLVKVLAICGFIVLGGLLLWHMPAGTAAHNLLRSPTFLPHGMSGAWRASVVAIFSFFSLEGIAVAAAEARDPRTAVVRAFRGTLLRLLLFYVLTLAVILALAPWSATAADAGVRSSPFVQVLRALHTPYAAGVLNFVVLIAALSAMNSLLYLTSRMLHSLAISGFAPRGLRVLSRRGVPLRALCVSSLGIGLAFALQVFAPARAFTTTMAVATFGALFTWGAIFVTHLRFRAKFVGALPFRMWGYPLTPLIGALIIGALLVTTRWVPGFTETLVYGVPALGLLALTYLPLKRRRAAHGTVEAEARSEAWKQV